VIVDEGFWRGNGWGHHHFLRRQHHDTVPYHETLVSWLLWERLGQADHNDLLCALAAMRNPPSKVVHNGGSARGYQGVGGGLSVGLSVVPV
jgi:hypothetical protein